MKFVYSMLVLVLSTLLSLPWACSSNNPVASTPVTVVLQQPSGSNSNPTPTATSAPATFMIWQNGTAGCFNGDCLINQVNIGLAGTTLVTGNALEWDSTSTNCSPSMSGNISNPANMTAYANGHLQLDIKLGQSAASYSSIVVGCGVLYSVNLSLLSTASFTHVSVPLETAVASSNLSIWFAAPFQIILYCSSPFPSSGPLLYINNVEWTSN